MNEALNYIGITPTFLKSAFEVSLLSLFVVCLIHSGVTHGWKRTAREFSAGFFLTAFCESAGVLSGAYVYPGFNIYIFAVPVANPASWIALIYIIMELTNRIVFGVEAMEGNKRLTLFNGNIIKTVLCLAVIDASIALGLDLVLDPLATIYNWWIWVPVAEGVSKVNTGLVDPYNFSQLAFMITPDNAVYEFFKGFFPEGLRYPTRLFGIPLINFISWFVFVFIFTTQFRWVELRDNWSELKKTTILWLLILIDIPVLSFVLISPNI